MSPVHARWEVEEQMRNLSGLAVLVLVGLAVLPDAALADRPEINMRGPAGVFSSGEEWTHALRGYDSVAYFTEGRPVRGIDAFASRHRGAPFRFSSAEHKALFDADPDRYVPRFGGYCAYAVSQGSLASGDPLVWDIHEGKLYLNLNRDIQRLWKTRKEQFIEDAEKRWSGILAE